MRLKVSETEIDYILNLADVLKNGMIEYKATQAII